VNLRILQRLDLPSKEKEQEKQIVIAEAASVENPPLDLLRGAESWSSGLSTLAIMPVATRV
jgi:hypothetical protein